MLPDCHLTHKIQWSKVVEYIRFDPSGIVLPVGNCGLIHADKAVQIQVNSRNFIKSEMICLAKNCPTIGEKFYSKEKVLEPDIARFYIRNNNPSKAKQMEYFSRTFKTTLKEFIQTEESKYSEGMISRINIPSEDDLKAMRDATIGCRGCYPTFCERNCDIALVFDLFCQQRHDLLLALHRTKRIDLFNRFTETFGGQAVGAGYPFLMQHIFEFYIYTNIILACGYESKPEKWGNRPTYLFQQIKYDCDFYTFIPSLRKFLHEDVFLKDMEKTRILTKKCYEYIYQYLTLAKIVGVNIDIDRDFSIGYQN